MFSVLYFSFWNCITSDDLLYDRPRSAPPSSCSIEFVSIASLGLCGCVCGHTFWRLSLTMRVPSGTADVMQPCMAWQITSASSMPCCRRATSCQVQPARWPACKEPSPQTAVCSAGRMPRHRPQLPHHHQTLKSSEQGRNVVKWPHAAASLLPVQSLPTIHAGKLACRHRRAVGSVAVE